MIHSATLVGLDGRLLTITASTSAGIVPLSITGLSDGGMREARVRVQAALMHAGARTAVSLRIDGAAPNAIDGTGTDLALALAAAAPSAFLGNIGAYAELSLAGEVRPVRGVLPALEALRRCCDVVIVAPENAAEAALVPGLRIFVARTLAEAITVLHGRDLPEACASEPHKRTAPLSLDDVMGNECAKRALVVAAAGGHNVLLIGPVGAGKTMLARRLVSLLPGLTRDEQLEVTRVASVAGLNIGGGLCQQRPFRAPHHSTTPPGLVGGGAARPRPGEITLAHHGVLFLDELPEFSRPALEVLGEPIKTGDVALARAAGTIRFPARALVVASMSPCPCGRAPARACRCSPIDTARYLARLERVIDLFDLRVDVDQVSLDAVGSPGRRHEDLVTDVLAARAFAARAHHESAAPTRLLRVARTLADLDLSFVVEERHLAEAKTLTAGPVAP